MNVRETDEQMEKLIQGIDKKSQLLKMVVQDTELNVFQPSTCNTTHFGCGPNIALTP